MPGCSGSFNTVSVIMKPGVPWSVKGIEPKAREAAKDAARKAGMTLGEWLNHQIMVAGSQVEPAAKEPAKSRSAAKTKQSAAKSSGGRSTAASRSKSDAVKTTKSTRKGTTTSAKSRAASSETDAFNERMDELSRRIGALGGSGDDDAGTSDTSVTARSQKPARKAAATREAAPAANVAQERAEFSQFNTRLDRTDAAVAGLPDGLDQISGRLEQMSAAPETKSVTALESALENVVEHIELTDRRNSDVLKTIQARLSDLADRGSDSISETFEEQRLAIRRLEDRLGGLADRIDATETRDDSDGFRHIQDKLSAPSPSLDPMRSAPRSPPSIDTR